jgi:hypothetical protein
MEVTVFSVRFELSLVDCTLEFPATNVQQDRQCAGDGQNNGKTIAYQNKSFRVGCTDRTLVLSVFLSSFVCLCCAVPASMH